MSDRITPFLIAALAASPVCLAQVDLEFRVLSPLPDPGDTVQVGLFVVGQPGAPTETVGAAEAIFTWETAHLQLLGVDSSNPANLIFSGFPTLGSSGLNEASPPADGDGLFVALGPLGTPILADEAGTLLAILNFEALFATPGSPVELLASAGSPLRDTVVFDGTTPNTIVTGDLSWTSVAIRCGPFDLAQPFGVLDLADVNVFVTAFLNQDLFGDQNDDGIFDLTDINLFVDGFVAGCPTPP